MAPPAPTAASWRWSPTSSSFAFAALQTVWIWARSAVLAIADSSTTTRSPARSAHGRSSARGGRPSLAASRRRSWVSSHRAMFRAVEAFAGEHVGGDLGGREPDHPPTGRRPRSGSAPRGGVLPGLRQRTDHERLPGPGRADQRLHARAGGEDAAHRGGLVRTQLEARLGEAGPAAGSRPCPTGRERCARPWRLSAAARCGGAPGSRTAVRPVLRRPMCRRRGAARRAASPPPGRRASSGTASLRACSVSRSSSRAVSSARRLPSSSGRATLSARVRSGAVHADCFSCTSASAVSITSCGLNRAGLRPARPVTLSDSLNA